MSELLRMEHISKRFGSFYANKDISLTVNRGEVRYASLELSFPENAKTLFAEAEEDAKTKYESYKRRSEN